jgi:hypothetical protein
LIANALRMIGAVIAMAWLVSREKAQDQGGSAADSSAASPSKIACAPAEQ